MSHEKTLSSCMPGPGGLWRQEALLPQSDSLQAKLDTLGVSNNGKLLADFKPMGSRKGMSRIPGPATDLFFSFYQASEKRGGGFSNVLTLSAKLLSKLGWKKGEKVEILLNEKANRVCVTKTPEGNRTLSSSSKKTTGVSCNLRWVDTEGALKVNKKNIVVNDYGIFFLGSDNALIFKIPDGVIIR